jgi:hypothetical protein
MTSWPVNRQVGWMEGKGSHDGIVEVRTIQKNTVIDEDIAVWETTNLPT